MKQTCHKFAKENVDNDGKSIKAASYIVSIRSFQRHSISIIYPASNDLIHAHMFTMIIHDERPLLFIANTLNTLISPFNENQITIQSLLSEHSSL